MKDLKNRLAKHYSCTICQEIFIEPSVANCGHSFCKKCIKKWKRQNGNNTKCPLCRKRIRKISPNQAVDGFLEEFISILFTNEEKDSRNTVIKERLLLERTIPIENDDEANNDDDPATDPNADQDDGIGDIDDYSDDSDQYNMITEYSVRTVRNPSPVNDEFRVNR